MIREVRLSDAPAIRDIYNPYIRDTEITFEEEEVSTREIERRIGSTAKDFPYLVYEEEGKVVAYAYGSPWRVRSAYRYSSELSIYLDSSCRGKGIGKKLYSQLIDQMGTRGYHCLYGVVTYPNEASDALHRRLGFEKCGHFHQVGKKFGRWIDVAYWEKIL